MGLVFVGLFFGELLASLKVGLLIGFGWSVVWIIASALTGTLLIRLSPYALMHAFNTMSFQGFDPRSMHNVALAYLFGAILLIVPGVLSDGIGAVLLLYALYLRLFGRMRTTTQNPTQGDNDVIDVEIIHDNDCDKFDTERRV